MHTRRTPQHTQQQAARGPSSCASADRTGSAIHEHERRWSRQPLAVSRSSTGHESVGRERESRPRKLRRPRPWAPIASPPQARVPPSTSTSTASTSCASSAIHGCKRRRSQLHWLRAWVLATCASSAAVSTSPVAATMNGREISLGLV